MSTNFGSDSYASAFENLPVPDVQALRQSTLDYLEDFDKQLWYDEPITSILQGEPFEVVNRTSLVETKDAFSKINGLQQLATNDQVEQLTQAIMSFQSPHKDLRVPMREIEQELLTTYAGQLIGSQCLDFGKQDGITEMEEATMANAVERKLNDMLLKDEVDGKVVINRKAIYVSCVSNFTLFLDLFRKTLRSLELGIPCVILGRSNTSQHAYRWTALLVSLMKKHDIADMVTFLSCSLDDIKTITQTASSATGNLYATCSRELAEKIIESYPNTIASTGGPNTLVTTEWTPSIKEAIRMSATIESSGQCTALRHAIVPHSVSKAEMKGVFAHTQNIASAPEALRKRMFDGVYKKHEGTKGPSDDDDEYMYLHDQDAYIKFNKRLPRDDMEEYWRKVVVDFTQLERRWDTDENDVYLLAAWLNEHQPISLAINGKREKAFKLGKSLFEKTGLVVYTVGSTDDELTPPALTCQARPQEAEIFGEFPPRDSLEEFTKFPVFVPSSTPSYDSTYTRSYLESVEPIQGMPQWFGNLARHCKDKAIHGYCLELVHYLYEAAHRDKNPKRGFGTSRTALWGLQRPPVLLGPKTLIRCHKGATFDALAPILLLFYCTNAREQFELSVHADCHPDIFKVCEKHGIPILVQNEQEFNVRAASHNLVYNVVEIEDPMAKFPMVGHFTSLYFPMGHIKSTKSNDEEFVAQFSDSQKWLKFNLDLTTSGGQMNHEQLKNTVKNT
eukprot:CAMPEP_0119013940 /NCGR_PEP_ID=MMETSP1176-20130426/9266_1 /TAXON_ID=265551 /ORGANISM="Synedropsis recta cf, Strain CCMP1620" /LENGTH=731 /DNA_ID=CAMNT_0006967069 /DNA_START=210 /DNA_END=2405 /DNA_ORIENTATION=+